MPKNSFLFGISFFSIFLSLISPAGLPAAAAEADKGLDLSGLFSIGYILQDQSGDRIIDRIYCRIVLAENPSESEIAAAANLAARFGYESAALDFDFIETASAGRDRFVKPVVLIGTRNPLLEQTELKVAESLAALRPGQGLIIHIPANDFFGAGGVAVCAYDDSGLLACGEYLAGRFPNVWDLNGKRYTQVLQGIKTFFDENGCKVSVGLSQITVSGTRPGIPKVRVRVETADGEVFQRVTDLLKKDKPDSSPGGDNKEKSLDKLQVAGIGRLEMDVSGPGLFKRVQIQSAKPLSLKRSQQKAPLAHPDFSLTDLFGVGGMFSDSNKDFIPDTVNAYISLSGTEASTELVQFSARTGLESAGMRFPFVRVSGEDDHPEDAGLPILFGLNHYQTERLTAAGHLDGNSLLQGTGFFRFIKKGFAGKNGLVLSAADAQGLQAITGYLSSDFPYLDGYGRGRFHLGQIGEDVRRFFQARDAAGQSAAAIYKLRDWLSRIKGKDLESLDVTLALKEVPAGLTDAVRAVVKGVFPNVDPAIKSYKTGYGSGKKVFSETVDFTWEVDEFWEIFRRDVLNRVTPSSRGQLTLLISESPEVRQGVKRRIEDELLKRGISRGAVSIDVLCAYKQGFSWLSDTILPRIRGKKVDRIQITYQTLKDSQEIRWQSVHAPTRWLQEIFPIDTVLARELGIPADRITFSASSRDKPTYTVLVSDKKGRTILNESFNPRYVVRPFFDHFPEYESVRVTTGWLSVDLDGERIVDRRIKTDPERFWDHLQQQTYRKIIDYVMDVQEGRPSSANAPFFDEFRVDLTLSEPNYRLGIDEEVISSTEALHEDILFHTLALFNRIGARYNAGSMSYPGRILPLIQPARDGVPGRAKITFTGKERTRIGLTLTHREKGGEAQILRYAIPFLNIPGPKLRGVEKAAGSNGLESLLYEVEVTDEKERYNQFKLRATEETIDRTYISAEKMKVLVDILAGLQRDGLFRDSLSYDRVAELKFIISVADREEASLQIALPRSAQPRTTRNPDLVEPDKGDGGNVGVQWDEPIPPQEANRILARLNRYPQVKAYYTATSFLGRPLFAADILPDMEASHVAPAKLVAQKPTLMLFGRVHGNEVSSTSHILKLAELCATDETYRNYLKNVNLVLYPVTNPDGAQTAYEMQRVNPDFMLHAGRYGALGTDVSSNSRDRDNLYPEAGVVYRLRQVWLPDILIDMHGVPSHEWVQYFAGYSAWVRSRNVGPRSYWLPRGWYVTGFTWIEDKKNKQFEDAQRAIINTLTQSVMKQKDVAAMNRRFYDRYMKYGKQDTENYREYFIKDVQVEARIKGRKVTGNDIFSPKITYFSATTEAADETARGKWMELVCSAGLAHSTALLKYLSEGENRVKREAKEFQGRIQRRVFRLRPVLPKEGRAGKK